MLCCSSLAPQTSVASSRSKGKGKGSSTSVALHCMPMRICIMESKRIQRLDEAVINRIAAGEVLHSTL